MQNIKLSVNTKTAELNADFVFKGNSFLYKINDKSYQRNKKTIHVKLY